MLDLLRSILCVLRNLLTAILYAGVEVINAVVAGIAALAELLFSVLPAMPDEIDPEAWSPTALGWIAWFVPVGGILGGLAGMLALYFLFRVGAIALRWVKAM